MKVKKNDSILIVVLVIFLLVICLLLELKKEKGNIAVVYYENEQVLEISLDSPIKTYEVMGENGIVEIVAGNGKIKVEDENSPLHLCSKQGWIDSSMQTIVCLPNKIVIKIKDQKELDGVIK